jgi:Zn-dependent peptidase ImmA (M78 family)
MNIKQLVKDIKKKYNTNDPIKIINQMGIRLIFMHLGDEVNVMYQKQFGEPVIYVNSSLSKNEQKLAAGQGLGHCLMHPDVNIKFRKRKTLLVE